MEKLKKLLDNFIDKEGFEPGRYGDAIASLFHNYEEYPDYFDVFNYKLFNILKKLTEIHLVSLTSDLSLLLFTNDKSYVCKFEINDTLKLIDIEEVDEYSCPTYKYLPILNNNL